MSKLTRSRNMPEEVAFEMASHLVGHTIIREGFKFSTLAFGTGLIGALVAHLYPHFGADPERVIGFLASIPFILGTVAWVVSAWIRYGKGGRWEKLHWVDRISVNQAFDDMKAWQNREAK